MSIEKITLDAFRGATKEVTVNFDPGKGVTLIFGENGNGKSTIIDGFTFLCNQSRGSLDDRAGSRNHKFLVSSGRDSSDLCVELKTARSATTWKATLSGSQIRVTPDSGYPYLKVLRRATISKFIDADPNEKYKEIQNFIETPGIEKSEQTLRDAEKQAGQELNILTHDYTNAETQLKNLWEAEGKSGKDSLSWAEDISKQNTDALNKEKEVIDKYKRLSSDFKVELNNLEGLLNERKLAETAYREALAKQKTEESKVVGQTAELLSVLEMARQYIQNNMAIKSCPVCTQNINAESLKNNLNGRISSLDNLSKAVNRADKGKKSIDQIKLKVDDLGNKLAKTMNIFETFFVGSCLPKELLPKLNQAEVQAVKNNDVLIEERLKAGKSIYTILNSLVPSLGARLEEVQKILALKNAVSIQLNVINQNRKKREKMSALHRRLLAVLKVVEGERKNFVEQVLSDISGEICALMEIIHPRESLANIKLFLDPNRRGSLHIEGNVFSETGVPPQAYFSESHLDTLGICIWLAFTKKFSPPDALVILDDVLTSVDSSHLDRFIVMLDEIAREFGHVILTTHYRPWRDRYRAHQAANSNVHFIELKEWAQDRGIIPDTNKPSLKELNEWLEPRKFERQIVASKAGIFLESILDYLSLLYAVSIPRKASQDYSLGDYLNGFSSKKRSLLKMEHLNPDGSVVETIQIGTILDELDSFTWIRNKIGCHFSISGSETSDTDVRKFGEKVVQLGVAIICRENGDIPKKNKTGSYYESKSGRCRLYPLQMP